MIQTTINSQYEVGLQQQILKVFHASGLKLHDNLFGNKVYTNYQRLALMVLFVRSRKALRNFVSELKESRWVSWLGLREIPTKSSLQRWIKKFNLQTLRTLLSQTVAKQPSSLMAIDATGIDSFQRSNHYEQRLKDFGVRNSYNPYAKAEILVDTKTKLIHDFVLRVKPRHDTLGAKTIFKRLKQRNVLILADKGYDCEELHELVASLSNQFYAPVRDFKVKKPKGYYRRKCVQGHELYNQRNLVESIIRSLKVRIRNLRSKLHYMKKREFAIHIIAYNLEKLSQSINNLFKLLSRATIWDKAHKTKHLYIKINWFSMFNKIINL
jgi:transposase